jgi:hypothetical protein
MFACSCGTEAEAAERKSLRLASERCYVSLSTTGRTVEKTRTAGRTEGMCMPCSTQSTACQGTRRVCRLEAEARGIECDISSREERSENIS